MLDRRSDSAIEAIKFIQGSAGPYTLSESHRENSDASDWRRAVQRFTSSRRCCPRTPGRWPERASPDTPEEGSDVGLLGDSTPSFEAWLGDRRISTALTKKKSAALRYARNDRFERQFSAFMSQCPRFTSLLID